MGIVCLCSRASPLTCISGKAAHLCYAACDFGPVQAHGVSLSPPSPRPPFSYPLPRLRCWYRNQRWPPSGPRPLLALYCCYPTFTRSHEKDLSRSLSESLCETKYRAQGPKGPSNKGPRLFDCCSGLCLCPDWAIFFFRKLYARPPRTAVPRRGTAGVPRSPDLPPL